MPSYYHSGKSIRRVQLADGSTRGLPAKSVVVIGKHEISAEIQKLIEDRVLTFKQYDMAMAAEPMEPVVAKEVVPDLVWDPHAILKNNPPEDLVHDKITADLAEDTATSDDAKDEASEKKWRKRRQ